MTEVLSPFVERTGVGVRPDLASLINSGSVAHPIPGLSLVDDPGPSDLDELAAEALELGLKRVVVLGWRDYEDAEAGGSELYSHRVASLWADAGLDVTLRSSAAKGLCADGTRNGYRVVRRAGRHTLFPRTLLRGFLGRDLRPDGMVEVWNGMPFFSPVWARCPHVVLVHHVHAEMWRMTFNSPLAKVGETLELRVAPPLYRDCRFVTVSQSSRDEMVSMQGFDPARISLAPGGVDPRFSPGGKRADHPLVVSVGRLVPVKRLELLVEALVDAKRFVPDLRAVLVGEGYERPNIEAKIAEAGAADWITLTGHISDEELVDVYRRAWIVASTSAREGWNLTLSEAGACGTPAVASAVVGHKDNIWQEVSGLLAEPGREFTASLVRVLRDSVLRERLGRGALHRARRLTWESTAAGLLSALVDEAKAQR